MVAIGFDSLKAASTTTPMKWAPRQSAQPASFWADVAQ
jgi:hypothetical protein